MLLIVVFEGNRQVTQRRFPIRLGHVRHVRGKRCPGFHGARSLGEDGREAGDVCADGLLQEFVVCSVE